MSAMIYRITGVSIVCSIVCSGADHRNHQSSASLAFVSGFHSQRASNHWKRGKNPFDDVIICASSPSSLYLISPLWQSLICLARDRGSSSANTLELPRSCIWPGMFSMYDSVCGCVCDFIYCVCMLYLIYSRTIAHRANVICCTVPDFK